MAECGKYSKNSLFRVVSLSDARSIVYYSSIVHKSVTHLDLNIGEYSSFKREIGTLNRHSARASQICVQTKEGTKTLTEDGKFLCPTLHFKLTFTKSFRAIRYIDICPYCLERNIQSLQVDKLSVHRIWFERSLQRFVVLFIKQAKRKLASLKMFSRFSCMSSFLMTDKCLICCCFNILCVEYYNIDAVKGIFIALNIPEFQNEPLIVNEYLIYHNCLSNGNRLPETTDFGQFFMGLLMESGFYRFIPHLLNCGFSRLFEMKEGDPLITRKRLTERRRFLIYDIHFLHILYKLRSRRRQVFGHWINHYALEALTKLWRSIPDPHLSQKEITFVFKRNLFAVTAEEFLDGYERIIYDVPPEPTPRSLKHNCRIVIRKAMTLNVQLPHGISQLGLPAILASYLKLES
ncbi:hypothetical protein HNY73_017909 [Argiope bruennichi]|uniref:SOCS box domain-containing protein n=1 Tax=Argiope bruennichi TaxID=94029 RepID=A0A8T0ECA3_ARGBR|nr:hypothetical protein HNY73_017909 [Argiope bruennichi]